jgi:CBS domain-containing protein
MQNIRQLLEAKGEVTVVTVVPDASVFDAVTCMVENNTGAVLVMDSSHIKGILSERDYLRFISDRGKTARDTPVSALMTQKVIYLTPDTRLEDAMAIMTESRIRHIPILEEGRLLGIVSIGDLVKQISSNQERQLETLKQYINGGYPG